MFINNSGAVWLLLVLIALSLLLASCAFLAAITVLRGLKAQRRRLDELSTKLPTQLAAEVAELSVSLSSVCTTVKRLSSRIGMQDVRARRSEERSMGLPANFDQLSPAEKKTALRKAMASGAVRAIRDDGTPINEV